MKKGSSAIDTVVGYALGIVILVVLTVAVVFPQLFGPVSTTAGRSSINISALTLYNGTGVVNGVGLKGNFSTYVLSNVDTTATGVAGITVSFPSGSGSWINITSDTGTFIVQLNNSQVGNGSTSVNFNIPASLMAATMKLNMTANTTLVTNVTESHIDYQVKSTASQQGWDSNTVAIWYVLGVAIAIGVLIFIFKTMIG